MEVSVGLLRLDCSCKLLPDLRMSLRLNEIAFKFHGQGQIVVGIIKAKPWGRSYKTPRIIIIHDFAAFWFSNATSYHILP